jgi:hypothetical protein
MPLRELNDRPFEIYGSPAHAWQARGHLRGMHLLFRCIRAVSKPHLLRVPGLLSSEEQIPQIVNVRSWRKTMESLEPMTVLPWQVRGFPKAPTKPFPCLPGSSTPSREVQGIPYFSGAETPALARRHGGVGNPIFGGRAMRGSLSASSIPSHSNKRSAPTIAYKCKFSWAGLMLCSDEWCWHSFQVLLSTGLMEVTSSRSS